MSYPMSNILIYNFLLFGNPILDVMLILEIPCQDESLNILDLLFFIPNSLYNFCKYDLLFFDLDHLSEQAYIV